MNTLVGATGFPAASLAKGWWKAHRFLALRRLSQLAILGLFLAGPMAGMWIVKGNLSSSLTLGVLPLTDPFVLLQVLATRHVPELSAFIGAGITCGSPPHGCAGAWASPPGARHSAACATGSSARCWSPRPRVA